MYAMHLLVTYYEHRHLPGKTVLHISHTLDGYLVEKAIKLISQIQVFLSE